MIIKLDTNNPNIYKKKIWGNTSAITEVTGKELEGNYGEVFLASNHPDGQSRTVDGNSIEDLIKHNIIPDFPFLLKFLASNDKLSVQNHYKNKIEAWLTLSEGEMLLGLTPHGEKLMLEDQKALNRLLLESTEVDHLKGVFNHINFKKDEVYMVTPGLVHAIIYGTVLEPQNNSNLTNRISDWGRNHPSRPLHLEDFHYACFHRSIDPKPVEPVRYKNGSIRVACKDFALEEITATTTINKSSFSAGYVVEGQYIIDGETCSKGESFLITKGPNIIEGEGKLYIVYRPDLRKDIIGPMLELGHSVDMISQLGGQVKMWNDIYIELKEMHKI